MPCASALVAHSERPLSEARRERVIFYEEHHGDIPEAFPATTGLVRSIRVASVVFRGGQALPGTAALREVDVVPDLFHAESGDEYRGEVGGAHGPRAGGPGRSLEAGATARHEWRGTVRGRGATV